MHSKFYVLLSLFADEIRRYVIKKILPFYLIQKTLANSSRDYITDKAINSLRAMGTLYNSTYRSFISLALLVI